MLSRLRRHEWSPQQRAVLISVVAVVMGSLFVTAYSLALGDPVPHHIKAALIGDPAAGPRTVAAVQEVAGDKLVFERYGSVSPP
jgi:ABC-type phosphate transport system permease subunit